MYQRITRISMIDLDVNPLYIEDLFDDVCDNVSEHLYAFIGNDPVKAFHFAMNIKDWAPKLAKWQVRLYSRELRHAYEGIKDLYPQIKFWENKYMELFEGEDVTIIHFPTYILNNLITDNDEDLIKVAIILGANAAEQRKSIRSRTDKLEENNTREHGSDRGDREEELV